MYNLKALLLSFNALLSMQHHLLHPTQYHDVLPLHFAHLPYLIGLDFMGVPVHFSTMSMISFGAVPFLHNSGIFDGVFLVLHLCLRPVERD